MPFQKAACESDLETNYPLDTYRPGLEISVRASMQFCMLLLSGKNFWSPTWSIS